MSGEFIDAHVAPTAAGQEPGGVMVARVVSACDQLQKGRLRVRLPWRGGIEVWARLCTADSGTYFIPQEGDEVLAIAHLTDGNEVFVLGQVWNERVPPPRVGSQDPVTKRVLRTPWGHEIAFDKDQRSVVITTDTGQSVTVKPDGVQIAVDDKGKTMLSLDRTGKLSITAAVKISLDAPEIEIKAKSKLTLNGGSNAEIRAGMVRIN